MAWNQPGNNGQDNDPWGNNNNKKPTNNSSTGLFDNVKKLFKKGNFGNNRGGSGIKLPMNTTRIIVSVVVLLVIIWGMSGFYVINQNERGVVTRFGKVQPEIIQPGLNWNLPLVDKVYKVDTQSTHNFNLDGFMITTGDDLGFVGMKVEYSVVDPIKYLFNVTNVKDSLQQAADSALHTEFDRSGVNSDLTDGSSELVNRIKDELTNIISNYNMGIGIVDINFQTVSPSQAVQEAFSNVMKAQKDKKNEINEAINKKNKQIEEAKTQSAVMLANANAYKVKVELEAAGDVARFEKILPQYKVAPELIKEHLYIETMERILAKTSKIIVNDKSGNLMVLPLEQLLKNKNEKNSNLGALPNQNSKDTSSSSEAVKDQSQTTVESPKEVKNSTNNSNVGNTARTPRFLGK
ncbi:MULTISPECIES: FtsH protease activity modulator HflK [unclassified Gilliamella]|uniref:FtsH protease activity modulator HflK n=1 Tax=unclassified Gilliamella TaxID=2685620 RepID=UPI0013290546|nr:MULTISPECIES: FtsH protease activity modulator HflK [unclassified Gilliamella]MWN32636.1 FtsH protease activity modulator HflK [Gilliamella sp. Pra-s60]MWP30053.1 FtsH protease activity modulator HflK [Gilliamella sp. Pra-s54]